MEIREKVVLIDIDNTVIDTAVRKQSLLSDMLGKEIDINDVRKDFWLRKYLGTSETKVYKQYFSDLESEKKIEKHIAPLVDTCFLDIVSWLKKKYIGIVYVSSRNSDLENFTVTELNRLGLNVSSDNLILLSSLAGCDDYERDSENKKTAAIKKILSNFNVLAIVGDRPADILAAKNNNIPSILLRTTISNLEEQLLDEKFSNGDVVCFTKCDSWFEIGIAIDRYDSGQNELVSMRDDFISQYAGWLGEIDGKIRITVTISSIMTAVSGKIFLESGDGSNGFEGWLLGMVFLASVLSVLYS